jgi:hypothetical protein
MPPITPAAASPRSPPSAIGTCPPTSWPATAAVVDIMQNVPVQTANLKKFRIFDLPNSISKKNSSPYHLFRTPLTMKHAKFMPKLYLART